MAFKFSRYVNRTVLRTASRDYVKQLSNRNLRFIEHFNTANMNHPSPALLKALRVENEVWSVGSRFYKIAAKHYGDPSLWWIIPWFNKFPLESDYNAGMLVFVPKPLDVILDFFE